MVASLECERRFYFFVVVLAPIYTFARSIKSYRSRSTGTLSRQASLNIEIAQQLQRGCNIEIINSILTSSM